MTIEATVTTERWEEDAPPTARMRVTGPNGQVLKAEVDVTDGPQTLQVSIERPKLWWSNGYGDQPVYTVDVLLLADGQIHDHRTYHMGLRTIELRQRDDE